LTMVVELSTLAENPNRPHGEMIARAPHIEHGTGSRTIGARETLKEDVVQSSQARRRWAAPGGPGVPQLQRGAADALVVHVAADHDAGVLGGVGEDHPQLITPGRG